MCEKELPRPAMAHTLFDFLHSVDEHSKQRQSVLALETMWLTKSGYTRNLTTFMGMSYVDMQCWDISNRATANLSGLCKDREGDFDIKAVVKFIAKPLKTGELRYNRKVPQQGTRKSGDNNHPLESGGR